MNKINIGSKNHRKLKIVIGLIALLVAGFFIYKYSYIYLERRKYDKAAVAINKVADDLRAQGIETEFSRECERTQEVYSNGSISCGIQIQYTTNDSRKSLDVISDYRIALKNKGFIQGSVGTLSEIEGLLAEGVTSFKSRELELSCTLRYSHNGDDHTTTFRCGGPERFKLY